MFYAFMAYFFLIFQFHYVTVYYTNIYDNITLLSILKYWNNRVLNLINNYDTIISKQNNSTVHEYALLFVEITGYVNMSTFNCLSLNMNLIKRVDYWFMAYEHISKQMIKKSSDVFILKNQISVWMNNITNDV